MGQLTARQTARRAALEARVRDHHPLGAGLTVDTTHVVLSGAESRQSLNVALTRGRSENHIYLADAAVEPDSLPGVDSLNPTTAEDILAGIFRRDGAQTSATSRRILDASATQLRDAVLRDHRDWGGYLTNRARRVRDLAEEVHASAADPAAGSDSRGPRRLRTPLTWICLATSPSSAPRSASPMTTSDPPGHRASRRCGTTSVRPQTPPDRAMRPMGERPPDWIRLLPPTVRRDRGPLFTANDSPPFTMPALAWNALLRTAADLPRPLPAERGEARHRSTTPKAPSDERAGDPALAGSGAATPSP
jgi:hypothetical protein